jgi:hypothetical protein
LFLLFLLLLLRYSSCFSFVFLFSFTLFLLLQLSFHSSSLLFSASSFLVTGCYRLQEQAVYAQQTFLTAR